MTRCVAHDKHSKTKTEHICASDWVYICVGLKTLHHCPVIFHLWPQEHRLSQSCREHQNFRARIASHRNYGYSLACRVCSISNKLGTATLYLDGEDTTIISCHCDEFFTRVLIIDFSAACEPDTICDFTLSSHIYWSIGRSLHSLHNIEAEQSPRAVLIVDYAHL